MTRSKDEQQALVELLKAGYARGQSLKQLERAHGVAASYAGRLLKAAGVELRPRADTSVRREAWGGLNRQQQRAYRDRLTNTRYGR